jgi:flavin reductase (DIM6/NTAB) family NADH-FMN oxidoreductase RutF
MVEAWTTREGTLGWTLTLGLLGSTHTLKNFRARPDCVVSLPTPAMWRQVERLAPLTGRNPVPATKRAQFRFARDKFAAAGLTPIASEEVRAARVKECPVQLEGTVRRLHELEGDPRLTDQEGGVAAEVEVVRVHVRQQLVVRGHYIDPTGWQPLIYNFRHYFGLGEELGRTFRAEI